VIFDPAGLFLIKLLSYLSLIFPLSSTTTLAISFSVTLHSWSIHFSMLIALALAVLVRSLDDGPELSWNVPANSAWQSISLTDADPVTFDISWIEQTHDPASFIEFQFDSTDDNAPLKDSSQEVSHRADSPVDLVLFVLDGIMDSELVLRELPFTTAVRQNQTHLL
jgi:hypothetical protein